MALVRVRGPLKKLAGDCSEHRLEGATVADLLRELERAHPDIGGWILDERGLIRRHINVFVNGERGREGTAVAPDDRIEVLPAISGGSDLGRMALDDLTEVPPATSGGDCEPDLGRKKNA
jgi:molybdopterin converting factor small subunit